MQRHNQSLWLKRCNFPSHFPFFPCTLSGELSEPSIQGTSGASPSSSSSTLIFMAAAAAAATLNLSRRRWRPESDARWFRVKKGKKERRKKERKRIWKKGRRSLFDEKEKKCLCVCVDTEKEGGKVEFFFFCFFLQPRHKKSSKRKREEVSAEKQERDLQRSWGGRGGGEAGWGLLRWRKGLPPLYIYICAEKKVPPTYIHTRTFFSKREREEERSQRELQLW